MLGRCRADFPEDPAVWNVTDQFMFGDRFMSAPVYHLGARSRLVYFPKSSCCASWKAHVGAAGSDMAAHRGGERVEVAVPLDELALYECTMSTK